MPGVEGSPRGLWKVDELRRGWSHPEDDMGYTLSGLFSLFEWGQGQCMTWCEESHSGDSPLGTSAGGSLPDLEAQGFTTTLSSEATFIGDC